MKILLLNPPFLPRFSRTSRSPAVSKGGCVYYPMWMAYATGVLEKEKHEVKLLDAPPKNMGVKDVLRIVKEFQPELVVIDTSTASIHSDVKIAEKIKITCKCFTVLVGTHVSALPKKVLGMNKGVDAVAVAEYDYTLRDLAEQLEAGKSLKKVDGLVFREKGKIIENKKREFIHNLDELPFVSEVYKNHLDIYDYFYPANLFPEITIITGRGCPYRCTYCVMPQTMNGHDYRRRSVSNVVKEFEYIKKNFPEVKEVFIEDDTFTADPERVKAFCRQLKNKDIKMVWSCNARADVSLETLIEMKKAGCRLLCVGFESGEQKILNNIKKGTKLETIRQFMKDTKKAGILIHGCFMLGNKGETKQTIRKTINFSKELDPDTAQFFPIMVYPGTEAYDYFKKKKYLITEDYRKWVDDKGSHNTLISRPELSNEELVQMCDDGRKEFYLRPKYMFKKLKQSLSHPKEIPRLFKSAKTFFSYLIGK